VVRAVVDRSPGLQSPHHTSITAARADASRALTAKAAVDDALDGAGAGAAAGDGLGTCADVGSHVNAAIYTNNGNPIKA